MQDPRYFQQWQDDEAKRFTFVLLYLLVPIVLGLLIYALAD